MKCVDKRELERFLQGELEPGRLVAVDEHLSTCATCRDVLDRLPGRARILASLSTEIAAIGECPDYDVLSALAVESMGSALAPSLQAHLNMCELCARDVERMRELRSHASLRGTVVVQPGMSRARGPRPFRIWQRVLAGAVVVGAVAFVAMALRPPPQATVTKKIETIATAPHQPDKVQPKPVVTSTPPKVQTVAVKPGVPKPVAVRLHPLLKDGRYQLVKNRGGYALARVDGKSIRTPLEARIAALIAEKIRTGRIKPAQSVRVAMNTLRAGEFTAPPSAPKQVSPVGAIMLSNRPTFAWSAVDLADSYRLVVTDGKGNVVFDTTANRTRLALTQPLQRGRVYIWQVGVRFSESDSWANSRGAAFRIVSSEDLASIEAVKNRMPGSHLALATVYESIGLDEQAAREYRAVVRANPSSRLARRFAAN